MFRFFTWLDGWLDKMLDNSNAVGNRIAADINARFSELSPPQIKALGKVIKMPFPQPPNQKAVVLVVYNKETDLILAVHRKNDKTDWGLPGGKIDFPESPYEAALRELEEETCYTLVNLNYIYEFDVRPDRFTDVHVFIVDKQGLALHCGACEQQYGWVKPSLLTTGSFGEFNRQLFADLPEDIGLAQYGAEKH